MSADLLGLPAPRPPAPPRTATGPRPAEDPLVEDLIRHLDAQLASAQRLLATVERQSGAVRERDIEQVLAALCDVQAELERRATLERERSRILAAGGERLGVPAADLTLSQLLTLASPGGTALARERSANLRAVLATVQERHAANRALMRQELAFLDHLTRTVGGSASGGYQSDGRPPVALNPAAPERRVLDLTA